MMWLQMVLVRLSYGAGIAREFLLFYAFEIICKHLSYMEFGLLLKVMKVQISRVLGNRFIINVILFFLFYFII